MGPLATLIADRIVQELVKEVFVSAGTEDDRTQIKHYKGTFSISATLAFTEWALRDVKVNSRISEIVADEVRNVLKYSIANILNDSNFVQHMISYADYERRERGWQP